MSLSSSTGLSSGINYNDIITQLRQVNSRPIQLIQAKRNNIEVQRQALQAVNKLLVDFKAKAEALQKRENFVSIDATSSDANVIAASASGAAAPASYSVKVRQLAQAERIASQGVASADSTAIAAGAGTFSFKVGDGSTTTINVNAGTTLAQLRDSINAATGSKVKASIINDGTPSNPYRLVLSATESGAINDIEIVANDTTLNLTGTTIESPTANAANTFNGTIASSGTYTGASTKNIVIEMTTGGAVGAAKYKVSYDGGLTWSANDAFTTSAGNVDVTGAAAEGVNIAFTAGTANFAVGDRFSLDAFTPRLQSAQDAIIEVDGVQISRSSNTFANVLDGVTLTAKKVDAEAKTVTIQNNSGGVQKKVEEFITAYNALVDIVSQATKYDTENKSAAPLFGDSAVSSLSASLRSVITGIVPGLGGKNSLAQIGISLDNTGKLKLDSTKFNAALSANFEEVVNLFVESGSSSNTAIKFGKATVATQIGAYAVNVTQAAEQATVAGSLPVGAGGLTAAETLTISSGGKTITVTLAAGATIGSIVNTLNQKFSDESLGLTAANDGGALRFTTTAFGSAQSLVVTSDRDASAPGQLGIGTTPLTDAGLDVAGTINGFTATGAGRTLKAGLVGNAAGLELEIAAAGPISGSFTLSRGIGYNVMSRLNELTDSKDGLLAVREKGFSNRIEDFDKRIEELTTRLDREEERMRKQFNTLEAKLATLQSNGNYLLSQLASLSGGS